MTVAGRITALGPRAKQAILLGVEGLSALAAAALVARLLPPLPALLPVLAALLAPAGAAALRLHRVKLMHYPAQGLPRSLALALLLGLLARGLAPLPAAVMLAALFAAATLAGHLGLLRLAQIAHARAHRPARLLIWGAGAAGRQLAAALATDRDHLCTGFLDDDPRKQGSWLFGLPVHAPARLPLLAARQPLDTVVLALPPGARATARARLAGHGVEVLTLPAFAARLWGADGGPPDLARLLGRAGLDRHLPMTRDSYAGRSLLVTGAGGSIGGELSRQLARLAPQRLLLLDHSEAALYAIARELTDEGFAVTPLLGSVTDGALMARLLTRHAVDTVFHAAAYKHVPLVQDNPLPGIANNVLGTRTLAEAAARAGIARFVLISTDKAVRPTSVMGATKRLAEEVVQDLATRSATRFAMVRFGNVLGSSGSVVPLFADQIARGGPVTVTDPRVTRYFMTGAEAVRLTLLAGTLARGGDVFVLDMGPPQRILDLAQRMIRAAGLVPRLPGQPGEGVEIRFTGLRPGEKLEEELLIGARLRATPHPRILRASEAHLSELEIAAALAELRRALDQQDEAAALAALSRWVIDRAPPRQAPGRA